MSLLQALRNVVTPEMNHSVVESTPFLWTTRIVDIICTAIIGFILCYHIYIIATYNKQYRSTNSNSGGSMRRRTISSMNEALEAWTNTLNILTILYILCLFILLLGLTLNIWQILPMSIDCNIIVTVLVTLYHLSKSVFYAILVTRLQVAFYLSSLKYSSLTIVSLYLFIIFYTIFICVGTPFLIQGIWVTDPVNWCHVHTIHTDLAAVAIVIWIFCDVLISVILCYLFIRPIKQVLKVSDVKQTRFTVVYIKYALLTYISIILNLISLLLYLFDHLTILIEITAAINCICIVLMHVAYTSVFQFFCGCTVNHCLEKQERKQQEKELKRKQYTENVKISLKDIECDDHDEDPIIPVDGGSGDIIKGVQIEDESNSDYR